MDIKIIATSAPRIGSDCITHYKAKFEENPTLGEFIEWIFTKRSREWGGIYVNTGYSRKRFLNTNTEQLFQKSQSITIILIRQ